MIVTYLKNIFLVFSLLCNKRKKAEFYIVKPVAYVKTLYSTK